MSDAKSALGAVAFTRLSDTVTLAPVFEHVPPGTNPPVAVIGDIEATKFGTKGADRDRQISLEVITMTEGEERLPLQLLQAEVEDALDGATITTDDWTFGFSLQSSDDVLLEDGLTYQGTTRFDVLALSND